MNAVLRQHFALENIDHQHNNIFGVELEKFFLKLRSDAPNWLVTTSSSYSNTLSKIIKHHTGLTVNVVITSGVVWSIELPRLNKDNPIIEGFKRNPVESIDALYLFGKKGYIDGTVSLKTGMVSGDFTKVVNNLYLGTYHLSTWPMKELTAFLLHEIGHLIIYYEMLARFTRTNYILVEGIKRLTHAGCKEQRIVILNEIETSYGESIPDKEKLASVPKPEGIYASIILTAAIKESQHALGSNVYDLRSFEQLADAFVVRMGYGRPLAKVLEYIWRAGLGEKGMWIPNDVRYLLNLQFSLAYIGLSVVTGGLYPLVNFLLMKDSVGIKYDKPKQRLVKIKQQLVDALKEPNISTDRKRLILDDFTMVDKLILKIPDARSIDELIYEYVIIKGRQDRAKVELQEKLESFYNNDFFAIQASLDSNPDTQP